MALNPNEQFSTVTGKGSGLRIFPTDVQPKVFAAGTGTIKEGTALAKNTSTGFWVVLDADGNNGTNVLKGFAERDIELDADEEVQGQVMMEGRIHIDDIPLVTGVYNLAELKTAIIAGVRALGITVEGMPEFV